MDRLRLFIIIGVIAVHAAASYVVQVGWYVEQRSAGPVAVLVFSVPVYAGLIFGLAPLFFLSGWWSAESIRRHGAARYLGRRMVRLGLPLAAYVVLIGPLAAWLGSRVAGVASPLSSFVLAPIGRRDVGPMWFVAALLVFSLCYAVARSVRPGRPRPHGRPVRLFWLGVLVLAVLDFAVWLHWGYLAPGPWSVNIAHWPQSGIAFAAGAVAAERDWLPELPASLRRTAPRGLGLGLLALLGLAAATIGAGGDYTDLASGWHWQAAAFAICDGVISLALCLWLVAMFVSRWNAPLPGWAAATSRGSYAAYLLHPVVLAALSLAIAGLAWPAEAEFAAVAGIGITLSLALGSVAARLPWVRAVL
ncbi:MAG TPA: acyltransferase [Microlunatus sp.]|nr:acyltransferase [Microlunatus sp.]